MIVNVSALEAIKVELETRVKHIHALDAVISAIKESEGIEKQLLRLRQERLMLLLKASRCVIKN